LRATFVYPNSRRELLAEIAADTAPDSQLHGAMYLGEHGIAVRFHDPLLSRRSLPGPLGRIAWTARELTVPLEVGRTDVIFSPLAGVLPLSARVRGLPVVVINFGLNLIWRRASAGRRKLLGRSLRTAACVICLGDSQKEELAEEAQLSPGHVVSMVIPIDDRFFTPATVEADDGRRTIVTVGKDLARDYGTFAEAIRPLDVRAEVVAHRRNLEGLRLPQQVEQAGALSFVELRDRYARADCVVVPQHADDYPYGSEGGGLTAVLEGMAMARPVVATDRAILRDYVDDGVEALLVPPDDPTAMREAIERVLGDPALADALGAAGRARVERAHTSRGYAARLAPLLRSVV
jgi:glycosyltransferase involved in cell wall biosynthesis